MDLRFLMGQNIFLSILQNYLVFIPAKKHFQLKFTEIYSWKSKGVS